MNCEDVLEKNVYELNEDDYALLCKLLNSEDQGIRHRVSEVLSMSASDKSAECLIPFISHKESSLRNLAGEILINLGSHALDPLINTLNISNNNDDLKFIIDLLGVIGNPAASDKIIDILSASENDNVILACLEALGNLHSEEAVDYLIIAYSKNELYKMNVVEALGKIGTQRSLEFIISKYNEEDDLIRFSIIESLGLIGDAETFFFLLSELNQTEGPLIWPIISSISKLKDKFGLEIPFDERMKNAVLNTITGADPEYKKVAAYLITIFDDKEINSACLRILGDNAELDEIIKEKFHTKPKSIIITAVQTFNTFLNLSEVLNLVKDLIETNPEVISEFSIIEKRNIIGAVTELFDSHKEEIRRLSYEILFKVDPSAALLFLDAMINDSNIWNKLLIIDLIEGYTNKEVTAALEKLSADEDEMVRERASYAIKPLRTTEITEEYR